MYEAILSNGDRAEAETPNAVLFAADTMRREAVAAGATPRLHRETIITCDDVYSATLTRDAQNGRTRADVEDFIREVSALAVELHGPDVTVAQRVAVIQRYVPDFKYAG